MRQTTNEATVIGPARPIIIEYPPSSADGFRWRKIAPIIVTDGDFIGAVDLDKSSYRSFRRDKITGYRAEDSGEVIDAPEVDKIMDTVRFVCPPHRYDHVHLAAAILAALMCELSILKIIATSANCPVSIAEHTIAEFAKKDARFEIPGRFIPWGDRRGAWPVVNKGIQNLQPSSAFLRAFINTANENWHSPKRVEAFNQALHHLIHSGDGITPEVQKMTAAFE